MKRQQFAELMGRWRALGPGCFNAYYMRDGDRAPLPSELFGVKLPQDMVGKTVRTSTLYRGERVKDLNRAGYEEYVAWCCVVAWQNWSGRPCDFFDLAKAEQHRAVRELLVNPGERLSGGWYNGEPEEPRAISRSLRRIRRHLVEDVHNE